LVNLFAGEAQNPGADGETETKLNTREALLLRIIQLEQLLQLSNTVPATSSSAARRLPTNALPRFDVSPDEREQQLQQKLLELDIQAAEAEVAKAKLSLEKSLEANRKQPHVISDIEIRQQKIALDAAQVQLRRAQTVLQLFHRQAERSRRNQTSASPNAASSSNFSSPTQQQLQTIHREKLARLKAQNQRTAAEIERLERLLKESPNSTDAQQALDRLLKSDGKVADPNLRPSGNRE
jgi:hypothetical protein